MRKWLENEENRKKVDKIIFCTFLGKEKHCYETLLPFYFPPPYKKAPKEGESSEVKLEFEKKEDKDVEKKEGNEVEMKEEECLVAMLLFA